MYWRLPRPEWEKRRGAANEQAFEHRVRMGEPPGLLALADGVPIGWMQIGPRSDTPQWNGARRLSSPLEDGAADDARVWGITCFYVAPGWRRRGVTTALLQAGIRHATSAGARMLEACPVRSEARTSSAKLYVGTAMVFERAGFHTVAERKRDRPLMRLVLRGC